MTTVKHFEHLWEESEKVAGEVYINKSETIRITELQDSIQSVINNNIFSPKDMGKILFLLTSLSHKLNINVYECLQSEMNAQKISLLEPDEPT